MNTLSTTHRNLAALAQVLRRLDHSRVPVDPEQYRSVVKHVLDELRTQSRDAGLDALLTTFPELAQLYENLHYEVAGLCRSPLEPAVRAEQAARAALARARGA